MTLFFASNKFRLAKIQQKLLPFFKKCRLYVSLFPCHECAKYIIQSGIEEIIYMSDKYAHTDSTLASKRMLDAAGVKYRQMKEVKITVETEMK